MEFAGVNKDKSKKKLSYILQLNFRTRKTKQRNDVTNYSVRRTKRRKLTTLIKDVMFHKAYTRARPAERRGPWLKRALIPAGNGESIPRGRTNKTKKTSAMENEYNWSSVSSTKLKSAKSNIDMTRPTRSCKKIKLNKILRTLSTSYSFTYWHKRPEI